MNSCLSFENNFLQQYRNQEKQYISMHLNMPFYAILPWLTKHIQAYSAFGCIFEEVNMVNQTKKSRRKCD